MLTPLVIIVPDIAALVGDDGLVGQLKTILWIQLTQVCLKHDVKTTCSTNRVYRETGFIAVLFVAIVLKVPSGQSRSA